MAPKPHVQRTCLCCDAVFEGAENAVRCPACRKAGRQVTKSKKRKRREELQQLKAEREIEDQGGSVAEFREQKALFEVSNDQRRKRKERMQGQIGWLDQQSRKPKGYQPMLKDTAETPLGQLWFSLCYADGQINCLLIHNSGVPVADRERLLVAHWKLRLKGYTGDAVAKVCPASLLGQDPKTLTDALEGLPETKKAVKAKADPRDLEDLSDAQLTHLETTAHQQERQRLKSLLGL